MSVKQRIEDNFALSVAAFCIAAFVAGWTANEQLHNAARAEVEAKERLVEGRTMEFKKEIDELKSQLKERNTVLADLLEEPGGFSESNGIVITGIKVRIVGKDGEEKSLKSKIYVGDTAIASLGYRMPADKTARIFVRFPVEVEHSFEPSATLESPGFLTRKITFEQKGRVEALIVQFIPEEGEATTFKAPLDIDVL